MRTRADFEIVFTADGSPSLRISDSKNYVEKMHHSGGAMAESVYIYGSTIEKTLENGLPLRVLSLGLGLGYNEILTAALALKHARSIEALFSFESEPFLISSFENWLNGKTSEFNELYDDVLKRAAKEVSIAEDRIKQALQSSFSEKRFEIRGPFPQAAGGIAEITCVLYDAFSAKMSPELWDEQLLINVLSSLCAKNCLFSTYAATGSLNRALKATGFKREDRFGFSGKRESTFAFKIQP